MTRLTLRPTYLAGFILLLAIFTLPIWHRSNQSVVYRNFRVVEPGKLYRSGQMTTAGFERVFHEFGIRTVLTLRDTRDDGRDPEDDKEIELCRRLEITHIRYPKADWTVEANGIIPGDVNIKSFLKLLESRTLEYPLLIHCFAGIHRTGPYCAVYRMEMQGWSNADAIAEMKSMGTIRTTFADNLLNYLQSYQRRLNPADISSRAR